MDLSELAPFARISCPLCGCEIIVPRPFGAFMLEEPIGSGWVADVYRALDRALDREVAVKILDPERLREPGWQTDHFLAAARRAALLNHSAVIPIFSCGEEENRPYIVMQYMAGGSLKPMTSPAAERDIKAILRHMLAATKGLQAAAEQNLLHHGVKPSNMLLDADGNLKLGDFGLVFAAPSAPDVSRISGQAALIDPDAADYIAPECVLENRFSVQGDIFSLGASMYHLLTGQRPGEGAGVAETTAARRAGRLPRPAASINSSVPSVLSDLIMKMIDPDPARRPTDYEQVMAGIQRGLAAAISGRVSMNLSAGTSRRLAEGRNRELSIADARLSGTTARSSAGRRRKTSLVLNALLVSGVIWLSFLLWRFFAPTARDFSPTEANPPVLERGSQNSSGTNSSPVSPDGVSPAQVRTLHQTRPRPRGLDFEACRDDLKAYLRDLPVGELEVERERLGLVSGSRDYLVSLMRHLPFADGRSTEVLLFDGTSISGAIPYSNEKGIAIRPQENGQDLTIRSWDELDFRQFIAFFDFYIQIREKRGEGNGTGGLSQEQKSAIAEDCLRLALLCDWYGLQREAGTYAERVLAFDPSQETRIRRLLPECLP